MRILALIGLLAGLTMPSINGALAAESEPFNIGVFPRRNAQVTVRMFQPLTAYLQRELGREVRLLTPKDFEAFWQGVEQRTYDLVHFNQYHYIRARQDAAYRVFAKNEEFGSAQMGGGLFVRRDSGIERVDQLRGRKIVFGGGRDAMMAYIIPTYLLRQHGLQAGDYQEEFARNPPNAMIATYFHQADASGAGEIAPDLKVVRNKIRTEEMRLLVKSEPVSHLPWALKTGIEPVLADRVQQLLLQLSQSKEGRAILAQARMTDLVAATDGDFDSARTYVEAVYGREGGIHGQE